MSAKSEPTRRHERTDLSRPRSLAFIFLSLFSIASPARRASAEENLLKPLGEAFAAWAAGRPEDAAGSLEYVAFRSSDTALTLTAIRELATLLAEQGKNREAVAYLTKAEILAPEDPYLAFEKGWNLLSLESFLDARAAFEKALTLTGEADLASQARFGLALSEAHLGGPSSAASHLQTIYNKYPYLLSPAAQVISAQYEKLGKRQHAITFLGEALTYDPRNLQAEIDLARLYDKANYYLPAWQTYYTLSALDPDDSYSAKKAENLADHVSGKLDNLLYWTRMSWPVHAKPLAVAAGDTLRLGLFAGSGGVPSLLTEFSFIANTEFVINDSRLGPVGGGKANMQWNVRYNILNKSYELRDAMGSVIHSTRNSFRLTPKAPGGVILIKSPVLNAEKGVNRGDREVTGDLSVMVKENGFRLVNAAPVEALVPPIATQLAGGSKVPEELKALSVVVRTRLLHLRTARQHNDPDYELCDSEHCLAFPGLQIENEAALQASAKTRGEVLAAGGSPAPAYFHTACGGFTADGVNDNSRPPARLTPFNLYYRTLKAPADDLLCLAADRTKASDAVWTLMLKPKWIEDRLNRRTKIGYIRSIIVLKRDATGRALSMKVEGTAGSAVLEGFAEISRVLAAGALRSPLFVIRPVFDGKYPGYFLVRGIGTGHGRGYCVLGAHSLAKDRGAGYLSILRHYFPNLMIKKLPSK